MRVASLCYASEQGLGYLAKNFYKNLVTDFMIVHHSSRPTRPEWYPRDTPATTWRSVKEKGREFFSQFHKGDVALFFETPFEWDLIPFCQKRGILTVMMPMYECMPVQLPHQPDFFICPSLLDLRYYPKNSKFLPVPVGETHWHKRLTATTFVHNAGHGGLRGRNGTLEFLQAIPLVRSQLARFIIRGQSHLPRSGIGGIGKDHRVLLVDRAVSRDDLWATGDVFVFPEKFNGLSLPIQEARASGMLVMCGDRFPMNTWLPNEPMIPVKGYRKAKIGGPYLEFDEAIYDPATIAETIDRWVDRDIEQYSLDGLKWAADNSWTNLGPQYKALLEELVK